MLTPEDRSEIETANAVIADLNLVVERQNERIRQLTVAPHPAPDAMNVLVRCGPLTAADYDEAIGVLTAARNQPTPDRRPCAICGNTDHWAATCDYNLLVLARREVRRGLR